MLMNNGGPLHVCVAPTLLFAIFSSLRSLSISFRPSNTPSSLFSTSTSPAFSHTDIYLSFHCSSYSSRIAQYASFEGRRGSIIFPLNQLQLWPCSPACHNRAQAQVTANSPPSGSSMITFIVLVSISSVTHIGIVMCL